MGWISRDVDSQVGDEPTVALGQEGVGVAGHGQVAVVVPQVDARALAQEVLGGHRVLVVGDGVGVASALVDHVVAVGGRILGDDDVELVVIVLGIEALVGDVAVEGVNVHVHRGAVHGLPHQGLSLEVIGIVQRRVVIVADGVGEGVRLVGHVDDVLGLVGGDVHRVIRAGLERLEARGELGVELLDGHRHRGAVRGGRTGGAAQEALLAGMIAAVVVHGVAKAIALVDHVHDVLGAIGVDDLGAGDDGICLVARRCR